jgi:hypothetical protein
MLPPGPSKTMAGVAPEPRDSTHGVFPTTGMLMNLPRFDVTQPVNW